MSHSTVFVLLVVLAAISLVQGQKPPKCQGKVSKRGRWAQWGGVCFGSNINLIAAGREKCDAIITPGPECKNEGESCCVQCHRQSKLCTKRYSKSVGRNACCPSERKVGEVRPESGCRCCKECKRKRYCMAKKGVCITEKDPVYNVEWCNKQPESRIKKRGCKGWGCWCCIWNHRA